MFKILHISSPDTWRGGERQVANLMKALEKESVYQVLLCPDQAPLADFAREKDFHLYGLQKAGGFSMSWAKKIRDICDMHQITHIHAHDSKAQTYAVTAATIYKNNIPILVTRRVIFPIKKTRLTAYKYTHPHIKKIICISKKVAEVVHNTYSDLPISVIYDSIDTDKLISNIPEHPLKKTYNIPESYQIVGYIAALSREKDHITFIDTAKLMLQKNPKLRFLIVGEGDERANIEHYIARQGLTDHIILTGFIKDINALIPQLDLLLFTSTSEGLGSTILDFFLHKVPVVSTRCGGVEELIVHGKTGLLSSVGDVADLAKNAFLILNDQSLKQKIVEKAYDFVKENHSLEKLGKETLSVYRETATINTKEGFNGHVKISAIVPTLNEERNIKGVIENLSFADEVLIIDSESTDQTVPLAKSLGAKVFVRTFDNFSNQKNHAIQQTQHDWVVFIDADERIGSALQSEILEVLNSQAEVSAYSMKMKYHFLGRFMRFGSFRTKKVLRVFNKQQAQYDGKLVHEQLRVNGKTKLLKNKLYHHSQKDLDGFIKTQVFYAGLKAKEIAGQKNRFLFLKTVFKPPFRFLKHYIFQLGFLDGFQGFIFAGVQSYGIFIRYIKLWNLKQKHK